MAELEEEIIIIEDSAAIEDAHDSETANLDKKNTKKKKIFIFGSLFVVLLLIIIIIVLISMKKSQEPVTVKLGFLNNKLKHKQVQKIEPSKLENMIAKANYLYSNGSKTKALFIYEKIAQYSESISNYNLGVAQLKNKQYKLALTAFLKAINSNENRCVSAINAAVCSLHLKDKENFKYYIGLAHAFLPFEINSPLYSYYYTIISYYDQDYLNALNSLKNSTSNEYPEVHKNISAKINALFENDYDAISDIEKHFTYKDDFSLGLLYARVGNFDLAIDHLEESIVKNIQPVRSQLALGLINLKAGNILKASSEIKNITDMFPKEAYIYYPIKIKLKDSLFDTLKAQYTYRHIINESKSIIYQKIFAFSPYKVFNAQKTISYIRKGNANIYIDNVESAQKYLKTSSSSSSVNLGITKAIKKALSLKIREANKELQALVKIQPKHSILQYDLAITYAQMGNMNKANEHFLRSYYLDAKNYLSGIYAIMTSQLIHRDSTKLHSIIHDAIMDEKTSEDIDLYKTLLHISDNNYISAINWLNRGYKQRPLYLTLDTIIALKLSRFEFAKKATNKLALMLPHDILPHLMYIDAHFSKLKPKKYALEVMNYLKKQKFNFKDLYYGPYVTRYLYIQESLITGKLYYLRTQLKNVLESTTNETYEIESSLALASLFDKHFEEAYTLYNHIIDELKVQDAKTLFLGAVASTAANHHANAIALLELSKLKNSDFMESRYALALLYLEIDNNEGATIQLSRIDEDGFMSNYFDFDIDTNKLLFKKLHPKK